MDAQTAAVLTRAPGLPSSALHACAGDPTAAAMAFLNEVTARYPDAISFAPGAVHRRFLDSVDVADCLEGYVRHTAARTGREPADVRAALFQYGPSQGLIGDLVAEALRRDEGIDVPADAVLTTVGCQEALLVTLRTLCRGADDLVAVVDPCYVGVVGAARLLGLTVVPVADRAPGVAVDQLRAACADARRQGRRIRAVYVAPDFANPSGGQLDTAARRALLDAADDEDLFLVEDSAYRFTAGEPAPPTLKALDRAGRVVHIGTFAKAGVPGARVGYVVAEQPVHDPDGGVRPLARLLATVKGMVTLNTSPITEAVVAGMLLAHGGSLRELGRSKGEFYRANLARLLGALDRHLGGPATVPGVSWDRPAGGFFVRVRLPVPVTDALLERSARDHRVLWTPMRYFHVGAGGRHELRLACSAVDPEQIDEGVARLARLVRAEIASSGADRPGGSTPRRVTTTDPAGG